MKIVTKLSDLSTKATFLSSTNKEMELSFKNSVNTLLYANQVLWFGRMHTSYINSVDIKDNILTANTRNSTYMFKLLEDHKDSYISIDNTEIEKNIRELEADRRCYIIGN
jgi:hypothetical protein